MIDNESLARTRDPELLALGDLMERMLRWAARQDATAIKAIRRELREDVEDLEVRDLTPPDRALIQAAYRRADQLLAIGALQRLPPRLDND